MSVGGSIVREARVAEQIAREVAPDRPWGFGGGLRFVALCLETMGARGTRRGSRQKCLGPIAGGESIQFFVGMHVSRRVVPIDTHEGWVS